MNVHTHHLPIPTRGLADDCDRCTEAARRPFETLDRETMRTLLDRVRHHDPGRTVNEQIAMNVIKDVLWRAEVLGSLEGDDYPFSPLASRKVTVA